MLHAVFGTERSPYNFLGLKALYPFLHGDVTGGACLEGLCESIEMADAVFIGPSGGKYPCNVLDGKTDGGTGKVRQGLREEGVLGAMALESLEPAAGCSAFRACSFYGNIVFFRDLYAPGAPGGKVLDKAGLCADLP